MPNYLEFSGFYWRGWISYRSSANCLPIVLHLLPKHMIPPFFPPPLPPPPKNQYILIIPHPPPPSPPLLNFLHTLPQLPIHPYTPSQFPYFTLFQIHFSIVLKPHRPTRLCLPTRRNSLRIDCSFTPSFLYLYGSIKNLLNENG